MRRHPTRESPAVTHGFVANPRVLLLTLEPPFSMPTAGTTKAYAGASGPRCHNRQQRSIRSAMPLRATRIRCQSFIKLHAFVPHGTKTPLRRYSNLGMGFVRACRRNDRIGSNMSDTRIRNFPSSTACRFCLRLHLDCRIALFRFPHTLPRPCPPASHIALPPS